MTQKGIGTIIIIAIIVTVSAIAIAGIVSYLKGTQSLVAKDPSEMALSLKDLPVEYRLTSENIIDTAEEAAMEFTPHSARIWGDWGFEILCYRDFTGNPEYNGISCSVDRYSAIDGARNAYEYRYDVLSDEIVPMGETIGEQSFAAHSELFGLKSYGVYFREKNIFANVVIIGDYPNLADAVLYARIVESNIP